MNEENINKILDLIYTFEKRNYDLAIKLGEGLGLSKRNIFDIMYKDSECEDVEINFLTCSRASCFKCPFGLCGVEKISQTVFYKLHPDIMIKRFEEKLY